MSSKSLNLRFTAVFTGIFILGAILLSTATYVILENSMRRDDYSEARSRLLEFWATYRTGGLNLVRSELSFERMVMEDRLYMVRIAGAGNNTLFVFLPAQWVSYNPGRLETLSYIGEGSIIRLPSREDRSALEVSSLRLPDGNILQVGMSSKRRIEALARFRRIYLLVFLPLSGLSLLGGFLFSTRSLKPIRQLIDVTRTIIDTGRTNTRIPVRGSGDELDELVMLFNKALSRIDTLITGMRQSLDNVAHDLRTPMTRLRGTAEIAMQGVDDLPSFRAALSSCMEESDKMLAMLSTLMDISEAETGVMRLDRKLISLTGILTDIADLYSYTAEEKGVKLTLQKAEEIRVTADLNRIRQVIANLLDNAIKYTEPGGSVQVSVLADEDRVRVEIQDTGSGIPAEDIPRIWERLYRGANSHSIPGQGLGLGLVRAIIQAHNGEVNVRSESGKGSIFSFSLPVRS